MGVKSLEICAYVLVIIIIAAIIMYVRIYHVILRYRKSAVALRRNSSHTMGGQNRNYKAFLTTLLLGGSLFLFWLPYIIFHFLTVHIDVASLPDPLLHSKFFFVDFLPMLHFLLDPAIYGLRMMEIRRGYRKLLCQCNKEARDRHTSMETRETLMRNSVSNDNKTKT